MYCKGKALLLLTPTGGGPFSALPRKKQKSSSSYVTAECLAAQLAAEKLDDEWKQKISAEAARVKTAGPVDKVARVQIELAFHRTIWAAAQNAWLYDQLNKLATLLFTLNAMSFFEIDMTPEEIPVSFLQWETKNHIRGHQGVARAVLSGNPRNARESMILHVMGAPPLADRRKQVFQI